MRRLVAIFASATVAVLLAQEGAASAQPVRGIALDRFNPSERGSEWFALDSLDMRGDLRPAVGVVGEYANEPFVLYDAAGGQAGSVVSGQMFLHLGASLVLIDSLRVGIDAPFGVVDSGTTSTAGGVTFGAPDHLALGDMRASADLRLFGHYGEPITVAVGIQGFVPTGESAQYTSDDRGRGIAHLLAAGDAGPIAWSGMFGYHFRGSHTLFANGAQHGDELVFGGAVGLRVADKKLVIGPEVYGGHVISAPTGGSSTPVEALLGAHYTFARNWRVGAGAGPGITYDDGSPRWRVVGSLEWVPGYEPPKAPSDRDRDGVMDDDDACPDAAGVRTRDRATNGCPVVRAAKIADADGDGIPDSADACKDEPGPKNDDPKKNGCPLPGDRDGDGVKDDVDACADVRGVPTNDPKTNGCPADKDGDQIADDVDACPDRPGPKTDDPKTNGCPPNPDRDGDGIANESDACPDQAGSADPDPQKNGCPRAQIVGTKIEISDQVHFATASAVILPDSTPVLTDVAKIMKDHPEITKVRVEGHTDNQGPAAYNKQLSEQRAAAVVAWLVRNGVEAARLTSQGFGMEKPIAPNTTDAGRKANRRVEFHIESQ